MFFRRKKPITTVYFDIGGVVVDAPMDRYRELGMELFGCRDDHLVLCSAEFLPLLEMGKITSTEFWEKVGQKLAFMGMGRVVPAWKFKGFWESIMLETLRVHEDVLSLVGKLRPKYTVGALSNTISEHANVLQTRGLYQNFSPVVLSCQIGMRKPNADIYKKAAEMARCKPGNCLLIDDMAENIEGALKAGYQAIHFRNYDELRLELHRKGLL